MPELSYLWHLQGILVEMAWLVAQDTDTDLGVNQVYRE